MKKGCVEMLNIQTSQVDGEVLISASEAAKMCGLSRSSFYKLISTGRAPRPIKLGRAARWPRQAILEWISAGCPRQV